jgi:hypothetical protein
VILSGLVIAQGFWGWAGIAVLALAAAWLVVPAARRSAATLVVPTESGVAR